MIDNHPHKKLRVTWEGQLSPPGGAPNMVADNVIMPQSRSQIPVRSLPRDKSGQLTRSLPVPPTGKKLTVNWSLTSTSPATDQAPQQQQQKQQQGNSAEAAPVSQSQQRRGLQSGSAYHYEGDQTHGSAVSGTAHKLSDRATSLDRPHAVNTGGFKMYSAGSDSVFMSDDNNLANSAVEEDEHKESEMRDLSTQTPHDRGGQTPGHTTNLQTPRKWPEKNVKKSVTSITAQTAREHENNTIPLSNFKQLNGTNSARINISSAPQRIVNGNMASNPDMKLNGVHLNNGYLRDTLEQSLKKSLHDTYYGEELPEYLQQYERYISFLDKDTTLGSMQDEHAAAENAQNILKTSSARVSADEVEDFESPPQELTHTIAQFLRDYKSESDAVARSEHSEVSVATTTSAQRELLARHHFGTKDLPKLRNGDNAGSPLSSRSRNLTKSLPNRDFNGGKDTWPSTIYRTPGVRSTWSTFKSSNKTRNKSKSPARHMPHSAPRHSREVPLNNSHRFNRSVRSGQTLNVSPSRSTHSNRRQGHRTTGWVDDAVPPRETHESDITDNDDSSSTLITDDDEDDEKVETRDFQMQTPRIKSTQTLEYAATQTRNKRDTDNHTVHKESKNAQNAARVNYSAAVSLSHISTQTEESRLTDASHCPVVNSYAQTINEVQTQTPSHSSTQTDDLQNAEGDEEYEEKKEQYSNDKSSQQDKAESHSVVSAGTRKSKTDLIQVILNEVKDLKTQVDEKIREAGGKPGEAQRDHTTESELERHKHRDSSKEKYKHHKEKGHDRVTEWVSDIEYRNHRNGSRHHSSPTSHHYSDPRRTREESHRRHRYWTPPPSHFRGPVGPPPPHQMRQTFHGPPPYVRGPPPPLPPVRGPPPPPGWFPSSPQMMPPPTLHPAMTPALNGAYVPRPVNTIMPGNIPSPVLAASSPYIVIQDRSHRHNDWGENSDSEDDQQMHRSRSRAKGRQPKGSNVSWRNEINEDIAMATLEASKLKHLTEKMAGSFRGGFS